MAPLHVCVPPSRAHLPRKCTAAIPEPMAVYIAIQIRFALSVFLSACHELNVSINTYYTGDKVSIIDFENHEWTKHGDKRTVKR